MQREQGWHESCVSYLCTTVMQISVSLWREYREKGLVMQDTLEQIADILVIDDEADTRDVITYFLRKKGYHTLTAVDREEAMAILDNTHVHTILLDYMMPGPSATKFLEYLGNNHPDTKVILMTASNRAEILARMLGIKTYVGKPLDLNQVYEMVSSAAN
jgi:CheY-like chemotaxis protein